MGIYHLLGLVLTLVKIIPGVKMKTTVGSKGCLLGRRLWAKKEARTCGLSLHQQEQGIL